MTLADLRAALLSLRTRMMALLSLAVLPLGIIAVFQTMTVIQEARELEESDFLSRTLQAASEERALLRRAYGAASGLGVSAVAVGLETDACDTIMRRMVAGVDAYVFAGVMDPQGVLHCASTGEGIDLSGMAEWADFIADPRQMISVNPSGAASGQSVLILTVPIFDPETNVLLGASSVSVPHRLADMLLGPGRDDVALALIDERGRILSAAPGIDDADAFAALDIAPGDLDLPPRGGILQQNLPSGDTRPVSIVPLLEDRVYVVGLWQPGVRSFAEPLVGRLAPVFPLLMWGATLLVAFIALDRFILRHLNLLRRRMSGLSIDDPSDSYAVLDQAPPEIEEIATTYNLMVDRILADRAELADSLEEKELLLREVHHRVKNNLQLIASILNMQLRGVRDEQAKAILRRVQDRVLSLSTIHKALYTGSRMASVRADRLLDEVIQAGLNVGLKPGSGVVPDIRLDPLSVDPDQAVPLALLVNETVTNAAKYIGKPDGQPAGLMVRVTVGTGGQVALRVENTLGTRLQDALASDGTGLGQRLIEAFATQLDADLAIEQTQTAYSVAVSFTAKQVDDGDPADALAPAGGARAA